MTAVLTIDGYDLQPYLRVNPDDQLDPVDADRLEPQFADASTSEGDALISIHEGNAEHVWPLHLTPLKTGSFADTVDGLSAMVTDLNRRLKAAAVVEWRMDGATASTFIDVQHARFEADFNYRKAQKLWVSGVLRVWAKPYGHTGTTRVVGTAVASGLLSVPLAAISGDTDALAAINLSAIVDAVPVQPTGLLAGVAVVPTQLPVYLDIANVVTSFGWQGLATLVGASGAIASQMRRFFAHSIMSAQQLATAVNVPGRYRCIALTRFGCASGITGSTSQASLAIYAYDARTLGGTLVLGPTTLLGNGGTSPGWRAVDVGVMTVGTTPVDTAVAFRAIVAAEAPAAATMYLWDYAGMLVLPEEQTAIIADPPVLNGTVGGTTVATYLLSDPDEYVGRLYGGTSIITSADRIEDRMRGGIPRVPVGTANRAVAFVLADGGAHNIRTLVEIRARERFAFAR